MPKFDVEVSRHYSSRHVHVRRVEAATGEDALEKVKQQLEDDEFEPSDSYEEQDTGYDDAGSWEVSEPQFVREAKNVDEPDSEED